jgi:glycosyltransferase
MKISIITVTYNNLIGLKRVVDQVKAQSYQNVEHIIVDGNSSDGTVEYLNSLEGADSVSWSSESDKGIYDALNKGISKASGDIVGVLHTDDYFSSDLVLEKVANTFTKSSPDLFYGDLKYVKEGQNGIMKTFRYWKSGIFSEKKLRNGWMPPHPTVFLKKELCAELGSYNTKYRIASDYDYMLRALKKKNLNICYLPEVLVCMRVGGESNKSVRNLAVKSFEDLNIIKNNGVGGYRVLLRKNLSKIPQLFSNSHV